MFYKINYFTKKECKQIIELHKTYKDYGFRYDWYKETYDANNRLKIKSTANFYAYLIPNVSYTKWMYNKIHTFFEENTGIKIIKPLIYCQLYKYTIDDVFPKHIDLIDKFPNRRWNLGVNLNEDYEGGEYLCWEGMVENDTVQIVPKSTGTMCGYHSKQLHEIKKITKGERWSLVIKVESENIDEKKELF